MIDINNKSVYEQQTLLYLGSVADLKILAGGFVGAPVTCV